MIARIWTARATRDGARAYDAHFERTVMPELEAITGFEGATLMHDADGDDVEITVVTLWTSLDSIHAFAGDSLTTAVVHDEAARLLVDFDRTVSHHDVVFTRRARPTDRDSAV